MEHLPGVSGQPATATKMFAGHCASDRPARRIGNPLNQSASQIRLEVIDPPPADAREERGPERIEFRYGEN
jgi:hypothetical protein